MPLADRLSDNYRVVIIEKFGYGYSDEIDGERTVGIITEQDREALKKAVGPMRYMNAKDIFSGIGSDELSKKERAEYKALMYTKYAQGSDATINHEQWITARFLNEMREIHLLMMKKM